MLACFADKQNIKSLKRRIFDEEAFLKCQVFVMTDSRIVVGFGFLINKTKFLIKICLLLKVNNSGYKRKKERKSTSRGGFVGL